MAEVITEVISTEVSLPGTSPEGATMALAPGVVPHPSAVAVTSTSITVPMCDTFDCPTDTHIPIDNLNVAGANVDLCCTPIQCNPPSEFSPPSGNWPFNPAYNINLTDASVTVIPGFSIADDEITCADGYEGTVITEPCTADNSQREMTVSGCNPIQCTMPTDDAYNIDFTDVSETSSLYLVAREALGHPGGAAGEITCADGYEGTVITAEVCTEQNTPFELSGCDPIQCTSPTVPTGVELLSETTTTIPGFDVRVECATGYEGSADATACTTDGEAYTINGTCSPYTCTAPVTTGYDVTETTLSGGNTFNVGVTCADGYETSDTLSATTCTTDGEAYTINGTCSPIVCTPPEDITGYDVTETTLSGGTAFDVAVTCADGYETSDTLSATCTTSGPYMINGTCSPIVCTQSATLPEGVTIT